MKMLWNAALCGMVSFGLGGCLSMKSVADPQYRHATYQSIQHSAAPVPVSVDASFAVNGKPKPSVDAMVKTSVERVLRGTGAFVPGASGDATLTVAVNNVADIGAARAKGFGTGLTFGAAGSVVNDLYEFNMAYKVAGVTQYQATLHDGILTSIGNAAPPVPGPYMTPDMAFMQAVEDAVLNFVHDLQAQGKMQRTAAN